MILYPSIVGITLFLSHYYLNPSYPNTTYPINVVDMFILPFTFGIVFNFISLCSFTRKLSLRYYCMLFIGFLTLFILAGITGFMANWSSNVVNLNKINFFFLAYLYIFTGLPPLVLVFKQRKTGACGVTAMILVSSLFYFTVFIVVLATLNFPVYNTLNPNWENTKSFRYISVVDLIFVALQVAVNTSIFFLSVVNVIKLHLTVYQPRDTSISVRNSDYDSIVPVICNNY